MLGPCPQCGGRRLRLSHIRNGGERFRSLLGFVPVRCRECGHRFSSSLWQFGQWRYARCPRCCRLDLGTWSEKHYLVPWTMKLMLALGAKKYRCETCRHNFASFRGLKERFRFHRYTEPREAAPSGTSLEMESGSK